MGNNYQKEKTVQREPFLKKYEPLESEVKQGNHLRYWSQKEGHLKKKQKSKSIFQLESLICKHVLRFLPLKDCLRLKQVSKTFKVQIDASYNIYANELVKLFFQPIEPRFFISYPNSHYRQVIEYLSTLSSHCFKQFFFNYRIFWQSRFIFYILYNSEQNLILDFTIPKPILCFDQSEFTNYFHLPLTTPPPAQSLDSDLLNSIKAFPDSTSILFTIRLANLQNSFPTCNHPFLQRILLILYAFQNLACYASQIILNLNNSQQLYFYILLWKQYQYAIINSPDKGLFHKLSVLFDDMYHHPGPPITLQGIATRLWGQTVISQSLPQLLSNYEQKLLISRKKQRLDNFLSQFFNVVIDVSVNEHSVHLLGTSKFPIYYQPFSSFFNMILEQTENLYSSFSMQYPYEEFKQLVERDIELMRKTVNDWIVETTLIPIALNYLKEKLKRNINIDGMELSSSDEEEEEESKSHDQEVLAQLVQLGLDDYLLQRQLDSMSDPFELAIRQVLLEDMLSQQKCSSASEQSQLTQVSITDFASTRTSNLSSQAGRLVIEKGFQKKSLKKIRKTLGKSRVAEQFEELKVWEAKNMIRVESRNQKWVEKSRKAESEQVQMLYDMCRAVRWEEVRNLFSGKSRGDAGRKRSESEGGFQQIQQIQSSEGVSIASNIMNKIV